jgi:uncharacterized SAM-binding protein YcdF (DUF218 family)
MSAGASYSERLYAASDLFHMGKVKRIVIQRNDMRSRFNFLKNRSETASQRSISYLESLGVPANVVSTVTTDPAPLLGSWSEAQGFARKFKPTDRVVVVTSAAHTRRSLLCFQRALPKSSQVYVYSASPPEYSGELFHPIWLEYGKLGLYWIMAR